MAGLENLISSIYHEKQQHGSMLCAQHALNNLLQGNYFTAPDLSDIAKDLDALEHSYDGAHSGSTNMDDTGFFSVQVLENALTVWGLNLTRWRGENMRQYQDSPQTQLAFILNLEQHWFTLRRFGHAEPNINDDTGNGHWFNLNSFFSGPEWVGKLYLGLVLQQAESEGYSVFAVTQVDPSAPLCLPRTVADEIASTLPEPTSSNPRVVSNTSAGASTSVPGGPIRIEGLEDEDYELQAALQASLTGNQYNYFNVEPLQLPPGLRTFAPLPPENTEEVGQPTLHPQSNESDDDPSSSEEQGEEDPVAASMARSRLMLQHVRAHQEAAQRELWDGGEADAALEARQAERRRQEEDEAEQLRRAIAESAALAQAEGYAPPVDDDEELDVMDVDRPDPEPLQGSYTPAGHSGGDRVYDDDDAELQAALKASLEHVPQNWEFPELPSGPSPSHPVSVPTPAEVRRTEDNKEADDTESVLSAEADENATTDAPAEVVSVDELRRRRLARFGI